ncbi:MAG: hypothetical protein LBP64_10935 [Tannerella sp.]|jgi:hypothetical protein|nr:hypothetical protein [Tannerella sp.]
MELKILYVHGYGSRGSSTGKAIEKQVEQEFDAARMLYNHYYDEIISGRQIKEVIGRIEADCREFAPHIVIGSSFGGFLATLIPGCVRILVNPCLRPSDHIRSISPDMSEADSEKLQAMEHAFSTRACDGLATWGLFSLCDELFGGSGYSELYKSVYGTERLRMMDSPHRISKAAIRDSLMPVIRLEAARLG